MASVCGGCLSMQAAGVPLKASVAGIAMGLVKEGDRYAILTDILGDEDHYGDMDFKVCGTEAGITALQMDIKIDGLSAELMGEALEQARQGRLHILGKMTEALPTHRDEISPNAPQIVQVQVPEDMIARIIGKGGETIRRIQEECDAKINIDDDGIVTIASPNQESIDKATGWISDLTESPEEGKTYKAKVTSVREFGAFVEFLPSIEGLLHISEWDWARVDNMDDVTKAGEEIEVKLLEIDPRTGKFRLSRKALIEKPEGYVEPERKPRGDRPPRRDGDRRGGGRGRHSDRGDRRPRRNDDEKPAAASESSDD